MPKYSRHDSEAENLRMQTAQPWYEVNLEMAVFIQFYVYLSFTSKISESCLICLLTVLTDQCSICHFHLTVQAF